MGGPTWSLEKLPDILVVPPMLLNVLSFAGPLPGVGLELGSRKVTVLEDPMIEPAEFTVVNGMLPTDLE